jgi:hypothetical protein
MDKADTFSYDLGYVVEAPIHALNLQVEALNLQVEALNLQVEALLNPVAPNPVAPNPVAPGYAQFESNIQVLILKEQVLILKEQINALKNQIKVPEKSRQMAILVKTELHFQILLQILWAHVKSIWAQVQSLWTQAQQPTPTPEPTPTPQPTPTFSPSRTVPRLINVNGTPTFVSLKMQKKSNIIVPNNTNTGYISKTVNLSDKYIIYKLYDKVVDGLIETK